MIEEWYLGFYAPYFRNLEGRIDPRGWFGHCEIWGYTADGTWFFLDPQSKGAHVRIAHAHDDVRDHISARFELCDLILRLPGGDPSFRIPIHGPMTCAAICGSLIGVRALLPATLRHKVLAKGAEVVHGQAERRSGRQGDAAA